MSKKLKFGGHRTYLVRMARTLGEIEELRSGWEAMQCHPNADIDFYLTVVSSRPEILMPHVLVLSENGDPRAMAVGRIEETKLTFGVGYKTVFKSPARVLVIIYGGLLGEQSSETANAVLSELMGTLRRREVDAVMFNSLPLDSPMYRLAKTVPGFFSRDHIDEVNLHWKMALQSNIDEFLKKINSKHRYWLRRLIKTFEKDFPGQVAFKTFRNEKDVEQLCVHSEEIARKTYQRAIGVGFVNDEPHQKRMRLAADRRWLRGYILYVNSQPAAFWIGTAYKGTFYLDFTGYDPVFRKYEPGTLLFMTMIEDCCRDGIQQVDFGFGDAFYKSRFGDWKWGEASVYIFAPTIKGIKLNAARTAMNALSRVTEGVASHLKLVDKVKRRWRQRLAEKAKN